MIVIYYNMYFEYELGATLARYVKMLQLHVLQQVDVKYLSYVLVCYIISYKFIIVQLQSYKLVKKRYALRLFED